MCAAFVVKREVHRLFAEEIPQLRQFSDKFVSGWSCYLYSRAFEMGCGSIQPQTFHSFNPWMCWDKANTFLHKGKKSFELMSTLLTRAINNCSCLVPPLPLVKLIRNSYSFFYVTIWGSKKNFRIITAFLIGSCTVSILKSLEKKAWCK